MINFRKCIPTEDGEYFWRPRKNGPIYIVEIGKFLLSDNNRYFRRNGFDDFSEWSPASEVSGWFSQKIRDVTMIYCE